MFYRRFNGTLDGTLGDGAYFINIAIPIYNLTEYSDNYSDTSRNLRNFKRDNIVNNVDVTNNDNTPSFKFKASSIGNTENNGTKNGIKIAVPLKYFINFWRSLEMPLINWKVELSLKWIENCVLNKAANANNATFKITDAKMYFPIVNLSGEANAKLSKLLSKGFKRFFYWNKYKVIENTIVSINNANKEKYIRQRLDASY